MVIVILPRSDDPVGQITESLKVINQMEIAYEKREKIILDFSYLDWILPCSAILISNKILEFISKNIEIQIKFPKNQKVVDYLTDIGFPGGNKEGSETYVPISHFSRKENEPNQINQEVNKLFKKIEGRIPYEFGDSVKIILSELSDNIDIHSQYSYASLMAQYYPTKRWLDISVHDNGISIPKNFDIHKISYRTDSHAIMQALAGEISTKKDEIMRGFGLKSCRRISTEGMNGILLVVSRKGILLFQTGKDTCFHDLSDCSLKGTSLYFRINYPNERINVYEYV